MPHRTDPDAPGALPTDWHAQELLLMREVMKLVGRSLAPAYVLREMLHLMSELLGLNRGRMVLANEVAEGGERTASVRHAYGLTAAEAARGVFRWGEGITGRVLASGLPAIVQDVDAEPLFLFRTVARADLPPQTVAFIALPIEVNGATVGVLACHRIRSRQRHLNDDLALLRILTTLAGQLLRLEQLVAEETRQLAARNEALERALDVGSARYGLIGRSPALLQALSELERVSESQATVLLLGESGTGKELFARAVHLASGRRDQPFIKVNCSAIPDTLFESELFGHERGAFTGATQARPGWFEQAHGGTIFLDEIGELPLALQAKLLRTLQEGTLVRLGGQREIRVDVRLVAATHRDLAQEAAAGRFRQDLYYRLNVIPIRLPSLRERPDDIPLIAGRFLENLAKVYRRADLTISGAALRWLQIQPWPGNVRQLRHVIERALLISGNDRLEKEDFEMTMAMDARADSREDSQEVLPQVGAMTLDEIEKAMILKALKHHDGNISKVADALGLSRAALYRRFEKFGIKS